MRDSVEQVGVLRGRVEELRQTLARLVTAGQPASPSQLEQLLGEVEQVGARLEALEQDLRGAGPVLAPPKEKLLEESG